MKYTQDFIEKVQSSSNLVDIISQYTQLKSSGTGLMGRCPFPDHQEKTPSFSVSELKQVYHCFGCHKSGNIFTFLRDYQGLNFPQAIEFLADRAGLPIPSEMEEDRGADLKFKKRKELLSINKEALNYFTDSLKRLPKNHEVFAYLQKREMSSDIIQSFKIGYALPEWSGLCEHLKRKNYSLELAEEARLVKAKSKEDGKYDIFRDRLIFPITNSMGEVLAFGGRVVQSGEPKYLNSPETMVFQKGKIFYGLEQTARYIRSEDQIIIVEGYMDLISLYQKGIRNVVATMGTALTSDHGRIIRKLTRNVVVLFDGDSAGREATERALGVLLEQDLYPKGLTLPDNQDPDDFVRKYGSKELKDKIDHSLDLMNLIFKEWMVDFHGEPSEKIKLAGKLKKILDMIPDKNYTQLYIQQLAPVMGVDRSWLNQIVTSGSKELNQTSSREIQSIPVPTELYSEPVYHLRKASRAELMLLSLVIKSYANMKIYSEESVEEFLLHRDVKKLLQEAHQVYRQSPEKFDRLTSLLVSKVDEPKLLFFNDPMKGYFRSGSLVDSREDSKSESGLENSLGSKYTDEINFETKNSDLSFSQKYEQSDEQQKEIEEKLVRDAIKRVRENYLKQTLKQISHELKLGATPEKMEKMIQIQKALKDNK